MKTQKTKSTTTKIEKSDIKLLFTKENYYIMAIGLVFIALGYILMIGGGSENPNEFNEAIFNTQRLTVSPILLVIGYILQIFAIFYKKPQKEIKG